MNKLIVANWKSNPATLNDALKLAKASDFTGVVIAPPFPYLVPISKVIKRTSLGAQNIASTDGGPYTGEVSISQLKGLRVKYVILGHSERRKLGETDDLICKKVQLVLNNGLKVILCVGENLHTRRKGITAAKRFIASQLKKDLQGAKNLKNLIVVYEPIWAISTSKNSRADTPQDSAAMISYIKKLLSTHYKLPAVKILYGGSVTPRNAKSFLTERAIDGALVGGASLSPHSFSTIIKVRDRL